MKKSYQELEELRQKVILDLGDNGTIWKHYKGDQYILRDVILRESDLAPLVSYCPLCGGTVFCRPLSEWLEEVSPGVKRYTRVD